MAFILTAEDLAPTTEPWVVTGEDVVQGPALKPKRTDRKVDKPTLKKVVGQSAVEAPSDPSPFESYDFQAEGGQPQIQLQTKPATSMDFRSPEVSIKTVTPKLKLTPTRAKRREDESFDEFNIRASQFESGKKQQELQAKAERAAVRSKVAPDQGLTKYPLAFAQGTSNVLAPLIRQGGLAAGIGPEETWDQQGPALNAKESGEWGTKIAEGLGSTVPFALTAAMTGTAGTALLGASSNAAQTYEEALAHGTSHEDALRAAIPGALIGSLEGLMGLGTGKFVGQLGKGTVKSFLAGIGEEQFQELTSQVLNNTNAKILSGYDPKRAISEGLYDTFLTTLGTAGLAHGATMLGGGHKATQAFEALKPAEQLEVGNALADPSPKSLASLGPRVREAALLNWQMEADPRLKLEDGSPKPVYHGTQSPRVIEEIDMSKSDPDALYGPGFYMTQSSEVAAGNDGYASTKSYSGSKNKVELIQLAEKHPDFAGEVELFESFGDDPETARQGAALKLAEEGKITFGTPHAYKLFANIRKPFDVDANISPEMQKEIFGVPLSQNQMSGKEVYDYIVNQQGSKAKANSFLREAGFDGITHIGGGFKPIGQEGIYFSRADAEKAAKERGAEIHQTQFPISYKQDGGKWTLGLPSGNSVLDSKGIPVTFESEAAADAYRDQFSEAYVIKGHRVWIAFDPSQVKSVWAEEFDPTSTKISASFRPTELQEMEQRALQAGKPVALRPETRDAYTARNQEIKQQLMTLDPSSGEFAKLADEHTRLARAIDDAPEVVPDSTEALRQHLIEKNLGHEGAADEMLAVLRPAPDAATAERVNEIGPRFYPNKSSETKGGNVYLSPEALDTHFVDSKGERSGIGALNENVDKVEAKAAEIADEQPALAATLMGAVNEARSKGLNQVSLITYRQGQGLPETRKLIRHESFHTGQWNAVEQGDIRSLHSPDILYHPSLAKMASSETGQQVLNYYEGDHDSLAVELAAYAAGGQHDLFGLTTTEAADYLTEYLTGIADQQGPEALDALAGVARLRPSVAQKVEEVKLNAEQQRSRLGSANRNFADSLRGLASISGSEEGSSGSRPSGERMDEGGVAEATDPAEAGGVAGGPPTDTNAGPNSGGSGDPLYTTVYTSDVIKQYAKKSGEALRQLGWEDPSSLLPPTEQILKVLRERPDLAEPAAIGQALREQGVNGDQTLQQIDETITNAAKTLQAVQAAGAEWNQIIKEFPKVAAELGKAGVGPSPGQMARTVEKEVQAAFKDVQASVLGRDLWRRSGDLYRKTLLTRFSTAANNAVSTLPRIPLDLMDGIMTGVAMGALQPAKWAGKPNATIAEGATAGAVASAQASMRVAMAFPGAAKRLLRRADPAHEFNENIIAQMEQLHPDLHSKLNGRSTGLDEMTESKVNLDKVRDLLPYLNDADKFKEYSAKLDLYQKRYDFNHKWAGKLFDKTNWVYDQFLKPGNLQEFFFRRPYFVGALAKRAADAGFDLTELARNAGTLRDFAADPAGKDAVAIIQLHTLADLPPEVWSAAADDALTFTYAYAPKTDRGRIEKFAANYIEFMDSMGPIGAVVDAFPKALYNGLKFAYEYSPLGAMRPMATMGLDAAQDGKAGIKYDDVSRVSKAVLGTTMYAVALGIRREAGGPEWWQIKTGLKDKKGQPIYFNAKKLMPFAGFLYVADVIDRGMDGRLGDKKVMDEAAELYFGARRTDNKGAVFADAIKETSEYWAFDMPMSDRLVQAGKKPLGQILGAPLTPFVNIRDLIAQFDEDEAAKRDMKGAPILGPAIDKLPWLRSSEKFGLPLYQPPTEPAPQANSYAPALTEVGVSLDPGTNFATREFSRLGISPIRWLKPDPDPKINRAQYASLAQLLSEEAPLLEKSDRYRKLSDVEKAAEWEELMTGGPGFKGLVQLAKEDGEAANPDEIDRRKLLRTEKPFARKASGLDKEVQKMKNTPVP
jgi:hypothetical protein